MGAVRRRWATARCRPSSRRACAIPAVSSVACFTWSAAVRSSAERGSGVGPGQRHDRGHVVPAHRVDVALEQRPFGRAPSRETRRRPVGRSFQGGPGPLPGAVHRGDSRAQQLCRLARAEQRSTSQRSSTARCFGGSSSMIVRQAVSIASPVSSSTSGPGSVEAGSRGGSRQATRADRCWPAGPGGSRPGRRWWRSGTARCGRWRARRSWRGIARPAATPPAARPRPAPASAASAGSGRAARRGAARPAR